MASERAKVASDAELLRLFPTCKVKLREVAAALIRAGKVGETGEVLIQSEDITHRYLNAAYQLQINALSPVIVYDLFTP